MADDRRISICIPNYNRTDMLLEAFEKVYSDERVSEIVISDDCSDVEVYAELKLLFALMPKVRMFRNDANQDCYRNKHRAIELAENDWVILLDSDNIIDKNYLDNIFIHGEWHTNTIFAPTFARETFDYRAYESVLISKGNVSSWIDKPLFETALNTSNFFINRNEYLKVWDGSVDPVTSDSIYFIKCWLNAGNLVYFVPDLQYIHRVHTESHYQKNTHRTPKGFHENILTQLRELT